MFEGALRYTVFTVAHVRVACQVEGETALGRLCWQIRKNLARFVGDEMNIVGSQRLGQGLWGA